MLLFDFQSYYKISNNHFFNDNLQLITSDELQSWIRTKSHLSKNEHDTRIDVCSQGADLKPAHSVHTINSKRNCGYAKEF